MRVYYMEQKSEDSSFMVTTAVEAQMRMWNSCSTHRPRRCNHIHPYVLELIIGQP